MAIYRYNFSKEFTKQAYAFSDIHKNDSIEEILLSDEWLKFKDSITKDYDKAPKVCQRFCGHKDKIKGIVEDD